MRLCLYCRDGLIYFSFGSTVRMLARDGTVDWIQVPNLQIDARLIPDEERVAFRVIEDPRFHGSYDVDGRLETGVSAFMAQSVLLTPNSPTHLFEGPAEIGLKACAHQPDDSRGLFIHVFTMAGANGTPVMLDFTVFVPFH